MLTAVIKLQGAISRIRCVMPPSHLCEIHDSRVVRIGRVRDRVVFHDEVRGRQCKCINSNEPNTVCRGLQCFVFWLGPGTRGGCHHHVRKIAIFHGKANGIGVANVEVVDVAIQIGVLKIRTAADEQVDIPGTKHQRIDCLRGCRDVTQLNRHILLLGKCKPTRHIDVVRNCQRGMFNGNPQQG